MTASLDARFRFRAYQVQVELQVASSYAGRDEFPGYSTNTSMFLSLSRLAEVITAPRSSGSRRLSLRRGRQKLPGSCPGSRICSTALPVLSCAVSAAACCCLNLLEKVLVAVAVVGRRAGRRLGDLYPRLMQVMKLTSLKHWETTDDRSRAVILKVAMQLAMYLPAHA